MGKKKPAVDVLVTPNSRQTTEGVSSARYTGGELSMFEQLRREFRDDIRREMLDILVDHPSGLTFGQVKKKLQPPFNTLPVLRILMELVQDGHVKYSKTKPSVFARYRLQVSEWIVRAAKKEGVA